MTKLFEGSAFILTFFALTFNSVSAGPYETSPVKIVNGTDAEDGEFPYMVQLFTENSFLCGGSIIGDKWILTAGHCVTPILVTSIVYGTNILKQGISVVVKDSYPHPKFYHNVTNFGAIPMYDIGIVELKEPIKFGDKAQKIHLADSDEAVPFHTEGVLSGWGATGEFSDTKYLQKLNFELLNDHECAEKANEYNDGEDYFNSAHNLCNEEHYDGECYGDSGSPFAINGTQYGISSWTIPPCGSSIGVYTRVTNPEYREFIRELTGI